MNDELILWLDLETTGLDPYKNGIIEVGCIFTDPDFEEIATFQRICRPPEKRSIWGSVAKKMHEKSGLFSEVEVTVNLIDELERDLIRFATKYQKDKIIIAGNSIHFDRRFIIEQMPTFNEILHHRMIDVSGMREAMRFFGGVKDLGTNPTHRTLEDCRESIRLGKMIVGRLA